MHLYPLQNLHNWGNVKSAAQLATWPIWEREEEERKETDFTSQRSSTATKHNVEYKLFGFSQI